MNNMIIKMMGLAMLAIIGTNGAFAQRTNTGGHTASHTTHVSKAQAHHSPSYTKAAHHADHRHFAAPVKHVPAHHGRVSYQPAAPRIVHTPHHHYIAPRRHYIHPHACILPAPRAHMLPGTLVEAIPANYVIVSLGGVQYYMANGIHYSPVLYGGRLLYYVI